MNYDFGPCETKGGVGGSGLRGSEVKIYFCTENILLQLNSITIASHGAHTRIPPADSPMLS